MTNSNVGTNGFKELKSYKVLEKIGSGTFGEVRLGVHILTKEKVKSD